MISDEGDALAKFANAEILEELAPGLATLSMVTMILIVAVSAISAIVGMILSLVMSP